jgi:hypothetical protein
MRGNIHGISVLEMEITGNHRGRSKKEKARTQAVPLLNPQHILETTCKSQAELIPAMFEA